MKSCLQSDVYQSSNNLDPYPIVKARSLALRFADTNPCCVRAIPYQNPNKVGEQKSFTMCLYVDNGNKGILDGLTKAANETFVDYEIEYVDLQRRPIPQIVTHLPASKRVKDKDLRVLSRMIEKNLHIFENRLNVTAVQASYKIVDANERDIPCITVFVLGKRRIPLGETDLKKLDKNPFYVELDVVEGYFQPCSNESKSYAFPLLGGVGIGIDPSEDRSHVGTLGGFLEDENGKRYLLSCEHVLNPGEIVNPDIKIVQPAETDHTKALEDASLRIFRLTETLKKQKQRLERLKSTDKDYCRHKRRAKETQEQLEEWETKMSKVAYSHPRSIGKYCCGLKRNEVVEISEENWGVYVDAAIAELNDKEAEEIEMEKDDEPENDCNPLFGFKNDRRNGFAPTGRIVDLKRINDSQDNVLKFMKYGRTTGLTVDGEFETANFFLNRKGYKKDVCAGDLCHIPYILYCSSCEPVTNGNQVDLSVITNPICAKCNEEIKSDITSAFWARNCMAIRKRKEPFCKTGDSGALVFDNEGHVWGMIFGVFEATGSNFDYGLATPLCVVLQALRNISGRNLSLWLKKEQQEETAILAADKGNVYTATEL